MRIGAHPGAIHKRAQLRYVPSRQPSSPTSSGTSRFEKGSTMALSAALSNYPYTAALLDHSVELQIFRLQ